MKIENLLQAIPVVSYAIKNKLDENVHEVRLTNQGKHLLIKTDKRIFWVLYKREFFHSFGKMFNLLGEGETINRDIFELAERENVEYFLFVYEDGGVFAITPATVIDYLQRYQTKRTTDSGEVTYSFSIGILERWL
jgi:hypothetical protein